MPSIKVERVDLDAAAAQRVLDRLETFGVSLDAVAETLEREGLASFAQSFDDLLVELETKAASL